MPQAYLGEIRWLAGEVVPDGWLPCDGRLLPNEHPLFLALNNAYGGDASSFALPDLRGRVAVHVGPDRALAQAGGQEKVVLGAGQMAAHAHTLRASRAEGDLADPAGSVWARSEALGFSADPADASMNAQALQAVGAGGAHENAMPFVGLTACICAGGLPPDQDNFDPDYFIGEVRAMAFASPPPGWFAADGQPLDGGDILGAVIGTGFSAGGATPAVPDLRGRTPIHRSDARPLGHAGGAAEHALTLAELPTHAHAARAAAVPGDHPSPQGRTWGVQAAGLAYASDPDVTLRADSVSPAGGALAHDNLPPYLGLTLCVGAAGLFPATEDQPASPDPFIGEVRMLAFDFAPEGWALCDGQLLDPNGQAAALFSVIGNRFGGDGATSFALPDLRGRAPLGAGQGAGLSARALGETGGAERVSLEASHLPAHSHDVRVRGGGGGAADPAGNTFGAAQARALSAGYSSAAPAVTMSGDAVSATGEGQPHENMPPYLPLNFCIALVGLFPA
jgi:microcystin-dependent protein